MRLSLIFLLTCLLTLIVHGTIWRQFDFVDERMWTAHLAAIGRGDFDAANRLLYTYPAGPLVMTTLAVHTWFNVPVREAIAGSMALMNAVFISGAVVVSRKLGADSWWWLGAGGLLIFNRLYLRATPPTIVVIPLIVMLIFVFIAMMQKWEKVGGWLLLWGIILGLSMATRYDIAAYTGLTMGIFLILKKGWKKMAMAGCLAIAVSMILNPYFWILGWQHYIDAAQLILYHYNDYSQPATLNYWYLFKTSPLAILGLMTAALWSLVAQKYLPISRRTAVALMFITFGFAGVVNFSQLQSIRYWFPFIFFWEIFMLWCVVHALKFIERIKQRAGTLQLSLIILIIGVQIQALVLSYLS